MYTVIVADDEQEIRRSLIRKVDWGSVGFQVIGEAENGAEALELTEKLEPDLLLTDIRMPFISGIDVTGALWRTSKGVKRMIRLPSKDCTTRKSPDT